ncbi:c-type cytochrome biogenesis protein CcmI [Yoonia sediminilitoris]|uniref:Cytochrome c-type biogenesis protein CcmH n=1 Tax=Yoonia sediminilitoris TaxID=1286148 RepID=A0A2T6KDU1_9RHOB|nr:c-type cytochrome biogenesis protein CcmI [Yoonia sediminilitoris]PUB13215.1 cytochrome c-type biogenesis protein CcmH [Yoonia sediminilitoris]RCW94550.1 cytochrome c-type biogenesis protein CcmH [Yoonia sediminilitoris]
MLFWLICLVLTLLVASFVVRPMLQARQPRDENPDLAVYRAQLNEIDRDVARDVLAADEAERARTEIARRLLAANKKTTSGQYSSRTSKPLVALTGVTIIVVSMGVYWQLGAPGYGDMPLKARLEASAEMRDNRPSQAELQAVARPPFPGNPDAEYLEAVEQLRAIAPTRPDDLQAWTLLAFHEAELRNLPAAITAQSRVIEIKGDGVLISDKTRLLDMLVAAAGGVVSPEAERLIRDILEHDDVNVAARFYLGELFNQTDRPDLAFRIWRDIVANGAVDDRYVTATRAQIEDAAFRAGITYTLPEVRGPSAEDVANAQDMTEDERSAMIGGMVERLADRLATQGGSAQDWARLISAYGVLGRVDNARAVWTEAQDVFGSSPEAMAVLTDAARQSGLTE